MLYKELSYQIIGCCYRVHSAIGSGLLELKSVKHLGDTHKAQLLNYLHISGCNVGYLLNFQGRALEWQRMVI